MAKKIECITVGYQSQISNLGSGRKVEIGPEDEKKIIAKGEFKTLNRNKKASHSETGKK